MQSGVTRAPAAVMPGENPKSHTGKTMSDRQNEEVELDEESDVDVDVEASEPEISDEDRGIVSDDEAEVAEREAALGNRPTRDDGDNDDEGELK